MIHSNINYITYNRLSYYQFSFILVAVFSRKKPVRSRHRILLLFSCAFGMLNINKMLFKSFKD